MTNKNRGRVIHVPQPLVAGDGLPPNRPLTVLVGDDEDVEWIWSALPNGQQYVSGYNLRKKNRGDRGKEKS
jgi:hypothetical protein